MTTPTRLLFLVGLLSALYSCQPSWKKTESGLEYKIISSGKGGPAAGAGSTVKLHYLQMLHDTVTNSTFDKMPYYKALIPGTIFPYDPFEALCHGVHEGDSVVVMLSIDSLLKKGKITQLPPHIKPQDKLLTCIKVLRVFPFEIMNAGVSDSLISIDKDMEKRKMDSIQKILGPRRIEDYLKRHNIAAPVTQYGTYLQVLQPGTGQQVDTGRQVFLKYKVSTLAGKVIDTNMDTTFHHTDTMKFIVGSPYMMEPIDKTIRQLNKGTHAKIYMPAMVARGNADGMESSYDDMIFEVKVLDVKNK